MISYIKKMSPFHQSLLVDVIYELITISHLTAFILIWNRPDVVIIGSLAIGILWAFTKVLVLWKGVSKKRHWVNYLGLPGAFLINLAIIYMYGAGHFRSEIMTIVACGLVQVLGVIATLVETD